MGNRGCEKYTVIFPGFGWQYFVSSLTVLLCSILFCSSLVGQESLKNFIKNLDQIKPDSNKYERVLHYEVRRSDPVNRDYAVILSDAIDYYIAGNAPQKALPLVNALGSYYIFGDHVDHDLAKGVLKKIRPSISGLTPDSTLMDLYTLSGELNIYTDQPADAIEDFNRVIELSHLQKDTLNTDYGYAHLKLAEIYSSEWNILESNDYFKKAADLFLQIQDTTMYLWALSGQSTLYSINGLYHEAEIARSKIMDAAITIEHRQIIAIAHLSAALEYKDRRMDSLEYEHLLKARKYINPGSEVAEYIKTIAYALQIQYFANQNILDSTDYFMAQFKTFYRPEEHGPWIDNYYLVAQAAQAKANQRYAEAEEISFKLIADAKKNNKLTNLTRTYDFLVGVYRRSGNNPKALSALLTYHRLKDSLGNIQVENQFLYYNQLFEAEKKDKQILQQEASIQLLSEKNKVLFWRGLMVVLTLSGLFLAIYLWRSFHFVRQKSALQEGFSQDLIQQQENERIRISQELHDGISQELILIKNRLDHQADEKTADLVAGTLLQLREVSRSLYPVVLNSFGLKPALEQLLNKVDEVVPEMEVVYTIEECCEDKSRQEELHIFRIVQEATTNVIKYARCSLLEVNLSTQNRMISLDIRDNGIGMELKDRVVKGIGMNSMEERTKILGGTFVLDSSKGHGTRIRIKIPCV